MGPVRAGTLNNFALEQTQFKSSISLLRNRACFKHFMEYAGNHYAISRLYSKNERILANNI